MEDTVEEEQEEDWTVPVENDQQLDNFNHQLLRGENLSTWHSHSVTGHSDPDYISKLGHSRTIVHIDIDCFYAQVEMLRNPELRYKPLGIQQKYLLVTCNYVAREYGVTKLMGIKEAKEKCPDLVMVSGEDLTHYREMSYKISEFLQKYTPNIERLGFDENFLDVSEIVNQRLQNNASDGKVNGHIYSKLSDGENEMETISQCPCGCHTRLMIGSQIASDIREALHDELGITCCAGISYNKLLAKLVAGQHKPNQQTTLFPENTNHFMSSLSKARNIPGVGWTMSKKLSALGVCSVVNLQEVPVTDLIDEIGETTAVHIKQLSYGIDDSPVVPFKRPQTLSDEDSFKKCSTEKEVRSKIKQLLTSLMNRLKDDGRIPHTVRLTIRRFTTTNKYTSRESRQCPLPSHVISKTNENLNQSVTKIEEILMSLFHKLVNINQPFHLTLINIAFCNLQDKAKNSISTFFSPRKLEGSDCKDTQTISDVCNEREAISDKAVDFQTKTASTVSPISGLQKWLNQSKSLNKNLMNKMEGNMPHFELKSEGTSDTIKCFNKINKSKVEQDQISDLCSKGFKRKNETEFLNSEVERKKKKSMPDENLKRDCIEMISTEVEVNDKFKNLPPGIDKEVFLQLPLDVQLEICNDLQQNADLNVITVNSVNELNNDETKNNRSDTSNEEGRSLIDSNSEKSVDFMMSELTRSDVSQGQNSYKNCGHYLEQTPVHHLEQTELKYGEDENSVNNSENFYKKVKTNLNASNISVDSEEVCTPFVSTNTSAEQNLLNTDNGDNNISVKNSETCSLVNCDKGDNSHSSRLNYSNCKASSSVSNNNDGESHNVEIIDIPPDIDREVFVNLPSDIQKEILEQRRSNENNVQRNKIKIKPSTLSKHKPISPKNPSILNYFGKARKS